jgi:hypothetical protein
MSDAARASDRWGLCRSARPKGQVTERLGSHEVDHQLNFCELLHWQISRPFALENPAGVDTSLPPSTKIVRSVAHKTASRGVLAH